MRRWMCIALALALTGCFPSGSREPQRYFVLEVPAAPAVDAKPTRAATLLVAPTAASSFYDSADIVYSRAPGTRAYYQFASWTEPPSRTIGALLIARLQRSGAFQTVASTSSGVKGGLLLSTQLEELYHDAATSPGSVHVTLSAELTDPSRRTRIARRTFTRSAPAATYDAPGAVQAFRQAVDALLTDVAAWVDSAAGPALAGSGM